MVSAPTSTPSAASQSRSGTFSASGLAVALAGGLLLADAAIETIAAGSPARWWALAAFAVYGAATALTFRRPLTWQTRTTFAIVAVLGVIAAAAWRPDGLGNGIHLLGQPTPRVLSALTAAALILGIVVVMRATGLPLFARAIAAVAAFYGVAAFALAAWQMTSYDRLFAGSSLWSVVPRWLQGATVGGLIALPLALLVSLAGGLVRGRRRWNLQQILAISLSLAIVVSGFKSATGGAAADFTLNVSDGDAGEPNPDAMNPPDQRTTAEAVALVRKVTSGAPPSTFDVDRKADEIGPDPGVVFAYVHDHIRTEIYTGVLRGARGTLMGNAGNSWDQALLLAALLRHRGRDVRFARARLTPEQAGKIVGVMYAEAVRPHAATAAPGAVPESIQRQSRALVARIQTNWRRAHGSVLRALAQSKIALGDTAASDAVLAAEAADHAWVEYREGSRWVPLDPVGADRPGDAVAAAAETFAEVPDTLYHHVTISVKAEERRSQKLEAKVALRYATTAAALNGAQVAAFHQIDHDVAGRWRAMPVLMVDDTPYGALRFTDAGVEGVMVTKKGDLIAQAHESIGQLGLVTEQFGGEKPTEPTPAAELTAVWLEFAFSDPLGHTDVVRRLILDRIGFATRVERSAATAPLAPVTLIGDVPAALAGAYGCAFTSGDIDPMLMSERLARIDVITSAASPQPNIVPVSDQQAGQAMAALPAILWSAAAAVHVTSQELAPRLQQRGIPRTLFYQATPRLAVASVEVLTPPASAAPRFAFALDLPRNVVRAAAPRAAGADLVRANVARGVLDGAIEDAVAASAATEGRSKVLSTVSLLSEAASSNIDVVATADRAAIPALALPEEARARLEDGLGTRNAYVAPKRAVATESAPRAAWWDVDLPTGETIGMLDNGLRGASPFGEEATIDVRIISPFARTLGTIPPPVVHVVYVNSAPMLALGLGLGIFVMGAAVFALSMFMTH